MIVMTARYYRSGEQSLHFESEVNVANSCNHTVGAVSIRATSCKQWQTSKHSRGCFAVKLVCCSFLCCLGGAVRRPEVSA